MPTYEIQDSSGMTITLEGDSPPTVAELNEIFAELSSTKTQETPQSIPQRIIEAIPQGFFPGQVSEPIERIHKFGADISKKPGVLPALGAIGAGLAAGGLPAIPALGLAAGPALGALGTAGLVGLGAGGGEAVRQLATFGPGGLETAKAVGGEGLLGTLSQLGFSAIPKVLGTVGPTVLQVFEKIPGEALKRMIVRWRDMSSGLRKVAGNQAAVDRFGSDALGRVQDGIEIARRTAGGKVDDALKGFQGVVKGQKVVDTAPVADALDTVFAARQLSDEAVAAAAGVGSGEIVRLRSVMKAIRKSPMKTPEEAVALRRALDDLTKFKTGGVTPVTSDIGQQGVREMGAALRESIQKSADAAGYKTLSQANAEFVRIANMYDEAAELFGTKSRTGIAMLRRLDNLSSQYYKGGLNRAILEDMATAIPGGKAAVNDLIDSIALRAFERPPVGTPSGVALNVLRVLGAPRFIGAALRNSETFGKFRGLPAATTVGTAGAMREQQ